MSLAALSHIVQRTLRGLAYAVLLGILVFVALTRTQVGRDSLRSQVEREFGRAFEGALEIGTLRGNLLNDLYASEVRLLDPEGGAVLSVDSVVVRPSWRDLFQRRLTAGRITLIHPHLELVREADGTWNLNRALAQLRSAASDEPRDPWSFTTAEVRIVGGTISTRNQGAVPGAVAAGHVFNFSDTELRDVQARATVEWRPEFKLIEMLRFSGRAPGLDLAIDTLQGQFLLEEEALSLNELALDLGETHLDLSASLSPARALANGRWQDAELVLDLRPSRLANDEIRRLFPAFPLSDRLGASARLRGPLSALVVESLALERGRTRLQGEGTVLGLPREADFDVSFPENTFDAQDLLAVWPEADLPDLRHLGRLRFSLSSSGRIPLQGEEGAPYEAAADVSVGGSAGAAHGRIEVDRPEGGLLHYTADLGLDALDVGGLLRDRRLSSRLNGRVLLRGRDTDPDSLQADLVLDLDRSVFAGRVLDTLHADVSAAGRRLAGDLALRQAESLLYADAAVDLSGPQPVYQAELRGRRLDLGPLLLREGLTTALDAKLNLEGGGTLGPDLHGELALAFDSSTVLLEGASRTVPPHQSWAAVARAGEPAPRLTLGGDIADLELRGDVAFEALVALGRLWGSAFVQGLRREVDKPYLRASSDEVLFGVGDLLPEIQAWELDRRREAARAQLLSASLSAPLAIEADLHLKRPELLSALVPVLPEVSADLRAHLGARADADRFELSGQVTSDSLRAGSLGAHRLALDLTTSADLDVSLEESLRLDLEARADTLLLGSEPVLAPLLTLRFSDRTGAIAVATETRGRTGPLRLAATLDLLEDRNRLTLSDFFFAAEDYVWQNPEDEPIDLYANAVVIGGLTLASQRAGSDDVQRLRIHGTLSQAEADTLFLDARGLQLRQFSDFIRLKTTLGGHLDGQLALTGGLRQPKLTGAVEVETLTFDDRLLGRFEASSRYVPGSPEIALTAELRPASSDIAAPLVAGPDQLLPEENRLRVDGTFRLPRVDEHQRILAGTLALDVDVERLDLFFFEYLFPGILDDVEGYAAGAGRIGGTLSDPLFEAGLEVREGRFDIPGFNLSYAVEGPVTVDREGIGLDGAVLRDDTGGAATLTGGLLFNDYRYFSFDLGARLDDLQIIDVTSSDELAFYGRIWGSGTASLTGPLHEATLRSTDLVTSPRSETYIPITTPDVAIDAGFIVFADSTGEIPDLQQLTERRNVFSRRPEGERTFLDGLEMDLNIFAPAGSTVHLVIDPLLGDVINAVGSGRIQLQRTEGEFYTYGMLDVDQGDYLFTAGDVFFRRFLIDEGTITWDGDPVDAELDIEASYRTRASRAGLPSEDAGLIPVIVRLHITGRVSTPAVDLSLALDRRDRNLIGNYEGLEAVLNQPDRATEYATSVLLTNTFLLTTESGQGELDRTDRVRNQLAFTSVSQLVSSQINRYLSQALPNVDFNLGLQGERAQDLDVTYGVALRLLDERLIIRGQGIYQNDQTGRVENRTLGEFVVEVRLGPGVSVEVFHRSEGEALSDQLQKTTGAGISYQTQFSSWEHLFQRLLGRAAPEEDEAETTEPETTAEVTEQSEE